MARRTWFWSSAPGRLSSGNGFVLSDALIAVFILSILALLVQSTVQSASSSRTRMQQAAQQSNEDYELFLNQIGECVCSEPSEESTGEDPADTSSSSY